MLVRSGGTAAVCHHVTGWLASKCSDLDHSASLFGGCCFGSTQTAGCEWQLPYSIGEVRWQAQQEQLAACSLQLEGPHLLS
jgi:hypothetical protein